MIDRGKVITGMETCIRDDYATAEPFPCEECYCFENPTGDAEYDCLRRLITDAITLLKEQDTVDHALEVLKAHGWKDDSEVTGDD